MLRVASLRHRLLPLSALTLIVAVLASPGIARSEGSTETGANQGLRLSTLLRVDILNASTETFVWTGDGTVTVTAPDGITPVGGFSSGQVINPLPGITGAYRVQLSANQYQGAGPAWAQPNHPRMHLFFL